MIISCRKNPVANVPSYLTKETEYLRLDLYVILKSITAIMAGPNV